MLDELEERLFGGPYSDSHQIRSASSRPTRSKKLAGTGPRPILPSYDSADSLWRPRTTVVYYSFLAS